MDGSKFGKITGTLGTFRAPPTGREGGVPDEGRRNFEVD